MIHSLHKELPYYFETCRMSSLTLQTCLTKYRKSNDPSARPTNRFSGVDPYCFECAEGEKIYKNNGGNMKNENVTENAGRDRPGDLAQGKICVREDCKLLGAPQALDRFYKRDNTCRACRKKRTNASRKVSRDLKKKTTARVEKKAPAKNLVFLVNTKGNGENSLYALYSDEELQKALRAGELPVGNIVLVGSIDSTMVVRETVSYELAEG